ncbi:unnamed protein product [Brassica rapa subsp. narinosa]
MDWWLSVEMTPTPMLASLLKTSDEIAKLFQTKVYMVSPLSQLFQTRVLLRRDRS